MKLALNLFLSIFALMFLGHKSLSLTDYKIKKICKKEKRESTCIKYFKDRRSKLQQGKFIEIPVMPYKN